MTGPLSRASETPGCDAGQARALNVEGGAAPEWIELIPSGPDVKGRDGRAWTMADAQAVVDASRAYNPHLPLDYEHATENRAPQGLEAPAAGWVEELQVRAGSVWGRVEWTPAGANRVANREYRFVSPVFTHDRQGRIGKLVSVALTNTPNLNLTALNRADRTDDRAPMEDTLDAKAIREALGLSETATDDQVVTAAREARAANSAERTPDLTRFVPMEQYQRAANRVSELEAAEKTRGDQARDAAIETAIDGALKAGKIVPASADTYRAMCREDGGLDRFNQLVGTLPVIASGEHGDTRRKPDEAGGALNDEEKAACRALGLSEDEFQKAKG